MPGEYEYIEDFDDSSDEDDWNYDKDDIEDEWERFSNEVLSDLKARSLPRDKNPTSTKINAIRESDAIIEIQNIINLIEKKLSEIKDTVEKNLEQISVLSYEDINSKEKLEENITAILEPVHLLFGEIKQEYKALSEKLNKLKLNEFVNVPALGKGFEKDIGYSSKREMKGKPQFDQIKNTFINKIRKSIAEKIKITEGLLSCLSDVTNFCKLIQENQEFNEFELTDQNCKFSFIAHSIGLELMRDPSLSKVYRDIKRSRIGDKVYAERFYNKLLATRIIEESISELKSVSAGTPISDVFSSYDEILLPLTKDLSKPENLRIILRKINQLNDYILLREFYECVDGDKISFAEFINLGNVEIKELILEKYPYMRFMDPDIQFLQHDEEYDQKSPAIQIRERRWNSVEAENSETFSQDIDSNDATEEITESDDTNTEEIDSIDTAEYDYYFRYKEDDLEGPILFDPSEGDPNETKEIIIECQLPIKRSLFILYKITMTCNFKSLKTYLLNAEKNRLIQYTSDVLKYLNNTFIYFGDDKPEKYHIETCRDKYSAYVQKIKNTDNTIIYHIYCYDHVCQDDVIIVNAHHNLYNDVKYYYELNEKSELNSGRELYHKKQIKFMKIIQDFLDQENEESAENTSFRFDLHELEEHGQDVEYFSNCFLNTREHKSGITKEEILQQIFLLIFRKHFYNKTNFFRPVLADDHKFESHTPVSFLGNVRLCNRSLTRVSRNYLQNPDNRFQIDTISSGSEILSATSRIWHFNDGVDRRLSPHSFFACDMQAIKTKRSEKRKSVLSREHKVAKMGSYLGIQSTFQKDNYLQSLKPDEIVRMIRDDIYQKSEPNILMQENVIDGSHANFYFASIYYLLFGVEAMRNPSMLIINHMLLDLLEAELISPEQLFGGCGEVIINKNSYPYLFGLMPTAPETVTARSRELNNLYQRYMPYPYIYPGDLARTQTRHPSSSVDGTKFKIGLNTLICREALVVEMWLDYKKCQEEELKEIANLIREHTRIWWKLDPNVDDDDQADQSDSDTLSLTL